MSRSSSRELRRAPTFAWLVYFPKTETVKGHLAGAASCSDQDAVDPSHRQGSGRETFVHLTDQSSNPIRVTPMPAVS